MISDTLVFDRTNYDVIESERILYKKQHNEELTIDESQKYNEGLKGCYTYTDLNRVESKVQELSDKLNGHGYKNVVETKSDWAAGESMHMEDIIRYLNNLNILINKYVTYNNTPNIPTLEEWIDYVAANNIEKILFDIEDLMEKMAKEFIYSGEISCGEGDWV